MKSEARKYGRSSEARDGESVNAFAERSLSQQAKALAGDHKPKYPALDGDSAPIDHATSTTCGNLLFDDRNRCFRPAET